MTKPTRRNFSTFGLVSLVLVRAVTGPVLGAWWPLSLLIAFSLPLMLLRSQPRRIQVAVFLTVLGGYIAASSTVIALVQLTADPAYQGRAVFGWMALGCATLATTACPGIVSRPWLALPILLIGSLAGSLAINLFYINTFYVAALPLWWAAALLMRLTSLEADESANS